MSLLCLNSMRNQSHGTNIGPLCICFLRSSRQIWVSLSWSSDLPYWLRSWIFISWGMPGTCSLPVRSWVELGSEKTPENTYPGSRYWVGLSWKIPREFPPSWKTLGEGRIRLRTPRAQLKHSEKIPISGKAQVGAGSIFRQKYSGFHCKTPRWVCCTKA